MRPPLVAKKAASTPELITEASQLAASLTKLSEAEIVTMMKLSPKLALSTKQLLAGWTNQPGKQRAAADSFLGDIYSGLQVQNWSDDDWAYAQQHLGILSGLYGIVKPLDGVYPYRLEMGYKLPNQLSKNMYQFWGDSVAKTLPAKQPILNLAAVEYSKLITRYVQPERIITPQFLTISPKTGEPTFVVVHAKIARGTFASWCIKNRASDTAQLKDFQEIGYCYSSELSTSNAPVFTCKQFGGLGLSVRLS